MPEKDLQHCTDTINAEDTSISGAKVDNSVYKYYIETDQLDAGDEIFGARIKFTI